MKNALGAAALMALAACTTSLELELDGKQCSEGRCVGGYVCDRESNLCVLPGAIGGDTGELSGGAGGGLGVAGGASGGAAGAGGASQSAGAGSEVSTGGGDLSGGGASAAGASGGPGAAGAGASGAGAGSAELDAGALPAEPGDACVPTQLYRDGDGDGFGALDQPRVACLEPGWVPDPGDCRDDRADVFPGQALFFADPIEDPLAPARASYDYDCDGVEAPDPDNVAVEEAPDCGSLGAALACVGSGFLPNTPPRQGAGIEPRCGSNRKRDCVATGPLLSCSAQDDTLDELSAFRCR